MDRRVVARVVTLVALCATSTVRAQSPSAPDTAAATAGELTPEQRYKRGKNSFEYGDCAATLDGLAPLAVPGQLQDEDEQLDVHRMLGVCYALADKQTQAAREFSSLLSIRPDFTLDPFLTPPAATEVFDRQKAAMKVQLEEVRRAREKAKAPKLDPSGGVLVERNTVVRDTPLAVSFMPFGLAQAANGETGKGIIVGVAEGAALATSVTTFYISEYILSSQQSTLTGTEAAAKRAVYQPLVLTSAISGMALVLVYGYGVGDALWNREDHVVIDKKETRRALTPDEIKGLSKVPPG